MWFFITSSIMFILILIVTIGLKLTKDTDWTICATLTFLMFMGTSGMGSLALLNNSSYVIKETERYINGRLYSLDEEYRSLQIINPDKNKVALYNEKATIFKKEILESQDRLQNSWINWYTCPIYNNYDSEEIRLITITIYTHL